ncbi:MAG: 4Fe-4S binding protein [Alphaproteobacteria bacterium]
MKLIINVFVYIILIIHSLSFANNDFIPLDDLQSLDPDIEKLEKLENNNIFKVYSLNKLKGYAFLTSSFSDALGFSSAEFTILIYISSKGVILSAKLLSHSEPLFLYDKGEVRYEGKGVDESILYKFILQYNNRTISKLTINSKNKDYNIDGVSSATITSILMHQSIILSTNKVLNIIGINNNQKTTLDHNNYVPLKWTELLADGSISNNKIYYSSQKNSLSQNSNNELLLDVYFSYANPIGIGQNIFGKTEYLKKFLRSGQDINDKGFFLATNGNFSLLAPRKCLQYQTSINIKNCENKGLAKTYFDRLYLQQGKNKFNFRTSDRKNFMFTRNIEDSTPRFFNEISLLFIDNPDKFDPAKESTLVLNFNPPEDNKLDLIFLPYIPPSRLIIEPENINLANTEGLNWIDVWKPQILNIIILGVFILLCSLILYYKDYLTKKRKLFFFIRFACLLFCLVWVGFIIGAQLTIVNVFNYLQLIFFSNFNYSVIIFDPLIVVISIATAISFIILGRGFFCGWLCPFGALQEIINIISRSLGIIQFKIKEVFHRKLIYIKYIILSVITIFLFIDLDTALIMTEVEPFKTSITLKFIRELNYVIYALILLFLSIFISRFYCRYICPLGAALAIGGKFRLFSILLRRKECGNPCHLCEKSCPTQAIKNNGKIDMNECFYCLDCQEEYYDVHRCPPLVFKQKKLVM